jgi:hypothetical protein
LLHKIHAQSYHELRGKMRPRDLILPHGGHKSSWRFARGMSRSPRRTAHHTGQTRSRFS